MYVHLNYVLTLITVCIFTMTCVEVRRQLVEKMVLCTFSRT